MRSSQRNFIFCSAFILPALVQAGVIPIKNDEPLIAFEVSNSNNDAKNIYSIGDFDEPTKYFTGLEQKSQIRSVRQVTDAYPSYNDEKSTVPVDSSSDEPEITVFSVMGRPVTKRNSHTTEKVQFVTMAASEDLDMHGIEDVETDSDDLVGETSAPEAYAPSSTEPSFISFSESHSSSSKSVSKGQESLKPTRYYYTTNGDSSPTEISYSESSTSYVPSSSDGTNTPTERESTTTIRTTTGQTSQPPSSTDNRETTSSFTKVHTTNIDAADEVISGSTTENEAHTAMETEGTSTTYSAPTTAASTTTEASTTVEPSITTQASTTTQTSTTSEANATPEVSTTDEASTTTQVYTSPTVTFHSTVQNTRPKPENPIRKVTPSDHSKRTTYTSTSEATTQGSTTENTKIKTAEPFRTFIPSTFSTTTEKLTTMETSTNAEIDNESEEPTSTEVHPSTTLSDRLLEGKSQSPVTESVENSDTTTETAIRDILAQFTTPRNMYIKEDKIVHPERHNIGHGALTAFHRSFYGILYYVANSVKSFQKLIHCTVGIDKLLSRQKRQASSRRGVAVRIANNVDNIIISLPEDGDEIKQVGIAIPAKLIRKEFEDKTCKADKPQMKDTFVKDIQISLMLTLRMLHNVQSYAVNPQMTFTYPITGMSTYEFDQTKILIAKGSDLLVQLDPQMKKIILKPGMITMNLDSSLVPAEYTVTSQTTLSALGDLQRSFKTSVEFIMQQNSHIQPLNTPYGKISSMPFKSSAPSSTTTTTTTAASTTPLKIIPTTESVYPFTIETSSYPETMSTTTVQEETQTSPFPTGQSSQLHSKNSESLTKGQLDNIRDQFSEDRTYTLEDIRKLISVLQALQEGNEAVNNNDENTDTVEVVLTETTPIYVTTGASQPPITDSGTFFQETLQMIQNKIEEDETFTSQDMNQIISGIQSVQQEKLVEDTGNHQTVASEEEISPTERVKIKFSNAAEATDSRISAYKTRIQQHLNKFRNKIRDQNLPSNVEASALQDIDVIAQELLNDEIGNVDNSNMGFGGVTSPATTTVQNANSGYMILEPVKEDQPSNSFNYANLATNSGSSFTEPTELDLISKLISQGSSADKAELSQNGNVIQSAPQFVATQNGNTQTQTLAPTSSQKQNEEIQALLQSLKAANGQVQTPTANQQPNLGVQQTVQNTNFQTQAPTVSQQPSLGAQQAVSNTFPQFQVANANQQSSTGVQQAVLNSNLQGQVPSTYQQVLQNVASNPSNNAVASVSVVPAAQAAAPTPSTSAPSRPPMSVISVRLSPLQIAMNMLRNSFGRPFGG